MQTSPEKKQRGLNSIPPTCKDAAADMYRALEMFELLATSRKNDDLWHLWLNYPETPEITPRTMLLNALAKARGEC